MEVDINIWDDYYEDGYVPEGKTQKTYMYVESDATLLQQQECLFRLRDYLKEKYSSIDFELKMRDSRKDYPNMNWVELGMSPIIRWEIKAKNISHKQREQIVANEEDLVIQNYEYRIYSES